MASPFEHVVEFAVIGRPNLTRAVRKLRKAEVDLSRGLTVGQVCKKLWVCEQTYYRWRKEYGGLRMDQAKRLKELEGENARLKKLMAEQALDISILFEQGIPVTPSSCNTLSTFVAVVTDL
jgi:putative transposase